MSTQLQPSSPWHRISGARLTPYQFGANQLDEVLDLLDEVARWMRQQGIDGWPASFREPAPEDVSKDRVEALRRHAHIGELWGLRDEAFGRQLVGTIIVSYWPDVDFGHGWNCTQSELFDARYLYRLATRRAIAGQGVGRMLVEFGHWLAYCAGVSWLRLDCSKTNTALHDYYRKMGFEHVNTVDLADRKSGALFQRPVAVYRDDPRTG